MADPRFPLPVGSTTIVVLGACRRVGSQICLRLALEGLSVIGVGWDAIALQHLQREMDDVRGCFHAVLIDCFEPDLQRVQHVMSGYPSISALIDCTEVVSPLILHQIASVGYRPAIAQSTSPGAIALLDLWQSAIRPFAFPQIIQILPVTRCASGFDSPPTHPADPLLSSLHPRPLPTPQSAAANSSISLVYLEAVQPAGITQDALNWELDPSALIPPAWILETVLELLVQPGGDRLIRVTAEQGYRFHYPCPESGATMTPTVTPLGEPLAVVVKQTAVGRGVFARRRFAPGERVLRTTGKAIAHQTEHSIQIGWDQHVEPDAPIRWLNHSCEPNLGVQTNEWGWPDFVAFRPIEPNDELTFDYAMTEWMHQPRDRETLEFELTCRCGTATCRGRLGYYSELPEALKQTYQGFISNYLLHGTGITLLERR